MDLKEQFITVLEDTLNRCPEEAISVLHNPKFEGIFENSSWELIPRLYIYVSKENRSENQQVYCSAIDLLLEIARTANPEDILFEFIEQAEKKSYYCSFIITLKAIKITLLRLPQRRGIAIGWCCSAIVRYLSEINIPQNSKLDGDEQVLLENDLNFQSVEDIYLEVLDFLSPFVKEIEHGQFKIPEKHVDIYKDTILKTLLKILGHPFTDFHLETREVKGVFRSIAENVINLVVSFHVDFLSFLDYVSVSDDEGSAVDSEFNNASLGVFYYLILVEGVSIETIPCVYSSVYLLKQLLWLCVSLMKINNANAQCKGLSLAESALMRISDKDIVFEEANRFQCKNFAEQCTKIMIYSESRRNREKAVPVFYKFLRMFDPRGRYYILLSVQDIVKEPGFVGYLATKCKDFVAEALSSKNLKELKYFSGKCLKDLIKKLCRLEDGSETDLMRHADQIIPCLNLLRYLIIRDVDNSTGFLDLIPAMSINYFTPLKKAVEVSRAHYLLQKREINQPSKSGDMEPFCSTVTVGELKLAQLSTVQKFQILDGALNTFDLIDSLLSRVIECIHDHKLL